MAPRGASSKVPPKSAAPSKDRSSPATLKKRNLNKNPTLTPKIDTPVRPGRKRTVTAPPVATAKKENPTPLANSVKKPLWKRRPLPAHSGVPVPEKMKQLFKKKLEMLNDKGVMALNDLLFGPPEPVIGPTTIEKPQPGTFKPKII